MKTTRASILLLIGVFVYSPTFSQEQANRPGKMSKKDFIALAQGNDSLLAVVNLVYRKRKDSGTAFLVGLGALVVTPILGTATAIDAGLTGGDDPTNKIQGIVLVGVVIFYTGTGIGVYYLIKYSRKRLAQVIEDFRAGKPLPKSWVIHLKDKDFSFQSTQ